MRPRAIVKRIASYPYAISLLDQGLLSAANFALGVVLIRTWGPDGFGQFAFWNAIALFCVGIQNTIVNVQMSVFMPSSRDLASRKDIERVLASTNFIMMVSGAIIFALVAAFQIFVQSDSYYFMIAVGFFIISSMFREYVRSNNFAKFLPRNVLILDLPFIVLSTFLFICYFVYPALLDISIVFGTLALGGFLSSALGVLLSSDRREMLAVRSFSLSAYRPIWKQARWSLLGVIGGHLKQRGYVYILASTIGYEAVGFLAAGQIIFRPVRVFLAAWTRIARPKLARLGAHADFRGFLRTIKWGCLANLAAVCVLYLVAFAFWGPLETLLYAGKYGDMGLIVAGWGLASFVTIFQSIGVVGLTSLKNFRAATLFMLCGAAVSLLITFVIINIDFRFVPLGMVLGSLVVAILLYIELSKYLNRAREVPA